MSAAICAGEGKSSDRERARYQRRQAGTRIHIRISELALPTDANGLGNVLGGKVMHLVDLAGAMAAMRHARRPVVTASIDHMNFLHPIHIGQLIVLHSQVNRVFRTSMEVGVKVIVEDLMTGCKRHTCSAYLTFVALDAQREAHGRFRRRFRKPKKSNGAIVKPAKGGHTGWRCAKRGSARKRAPTCRRYALYMYLMFGL